MDTMQKIQMECTLVISKLLGLHIRSLSIQSNLNYLVVKVMDTSIYQALIFCISGNFIM